jgi:hypothetical protein
VTEAYIVRHADALWTLDEMRPPSPLGRDQALILHAHDPRVGFAFWERISTPDIYRVEVAESQVTWTRLQDSTGRQ